MEWEAEALATEPGMALVVHGVLQEEPRVQERVLMSEAGLGSG